MNILIVEDNLISHKQLQTNLEQMGYQVTASTDGQKAWNIFDRVPYQVVVSDWLMPSVNGLEFCKKIR